MDRLIVEGGVPLKGEISVSGSKNAVLPILAATLLTDEPSRIENVPNLKDVLTMLKILRSLGARVHFAGGIITVEPGNFKKHIAPYRLVSTMRASFCLLGPILAKLKKAAVSLPGGCVIGPRPVDLHLKGLRALGADIKIDGGYVVAKAPRLAGSSIYLGGSFGSSVLATANVMMAAVLAKGRTEIVSAACEPEIVDLANFLIKMGARIRGHGTPLVTIEGQNRLRGARHTVIPDRIEAGTYMIAAALTKGELLIRNFFLHHLEAVTDKLREIGVTIKKSASGAVVKPGRRLRPVSMTTYAYPGFPTDLQAQLMSLLCLVKGISIITERIFPERFIHIGELNRMGAKIHREGPHAIIEGVTYLSGAPLMASDLRASAALVLAGLAARGRTEVSRVYHLERGYENLEDKLSGVGARIYRVAEKR
jgi:UDP-N-acetylglucosamine 1-carboxyvinyltransferase